VNDQHTEGGDQWNSINGTTRQLPLATYNHGRTTYTGRSKRIINCYTNTLSARKAPLQA